MVGMGQLSCLFFFFWVGRKICLVSSWKYQKALDSLPFSKIHSTNLSKCYAVYFNFELVVLSKGSNGLIDRYVYFKTTFL